MEKLTRFIPRFNKQKILVLGDVMLDKFVWGSVSRISPEAPVPVVAVNRESYTFGGAGNVANNLISLGSQVYISGVIGDDVSGEQLKKDLISKNVNIEGIVCDSTRPTIIKTRIIASHQQVVRVDRELTGALSSALVRKLTKRLEGIIPNVNAVIISDYGKGVINRTVLKKAISLAHKHKIPITVDPKIEHFIRYKTVSCITPNLAEAVAGMRSRELSSDKDVIDLGKRILKRLRSRSALITRGEKGMTLFEPGNKITHIPTRAREVFDVTGAGDTVISVFTLALAAKASFPEAAEIANFAAGVVVGKLGTATIAPQDLKSAILDFKGD